MTIGQLRKRITFEAPTPQRDSYGQNVPTWTPVATVWAAIKPLSGRLLALAKANTVTATATHQVTIRYRNDIQIGLHRIRYGAGPTPATGGDSYETLTVNQYQTLGTSGSSGGGDATPAPRYFTINEMRDVDEAHNELVLTATEVKA